MRRHASLDDVVLRKGLETLDERLEGFGAPVDSDASQQARRPPSLNKTERTRERVASAISAEELGDQRERRRG